MYDTLEEFYKAKYTEANDDRFRYLRALSEMTGYLGIMAKYSSDVSVKERIRIFERLIELWEKVDPDSETTYEWVKGWKKEIEELSK